MLFQTPKPTPKWTPKWSIFDRFLSPFVDRFRIDFESICIWIYVPPKLMLCCARLMLMPWSCYVHAILAENCLPSVSRRASRAERGERGITTYEAYRMVCVMFKLCSFHASPLHSKFTKSNALPVQMLSRFPEMVIPLQRSSLFGSLFRPLKPCFCRPPNRP